MICVCHFVSPGENRIRRGKNEAGAGNSAVLPAETMLCTDKLLNLAVWRMSIMEDMSGGRRKLKKIFMFVMAAALGVAIAVCSVSFGQERRVPIYGVDTDKKQVAISFDAAWGDEFTEGILDILDTYDVKATFFLVYFWSKEFPEDVKMIAERGHDIGNHSTTHPDMANLSEEEIAQELNTSADTIESLTGKRPVLFRPPYGSYSDRLINTAESLGYQTIQWSVDACAPVEDSDRVYLSDPGEFHTFTRQLSAAVSSRYPDLFL